MVQGYTMGARRTEFAAYTQAGTAMGHSAYGAGDGSQLATDTGLDQLLTANFPAYLIYL